jgi:hypothetical protein
MLLFFLCCDTYGAEYPHSLALMPFLEIRLMLFITNIFRGSAFESERMHLAQTAPRTESVVLYFRPLLF